MKNPPSASVSPPIHTTQRVPTVSSNPRSGCGNGGGGAAAPPAASWAASAGATDSTSGTIGGGSRRPDRLQLRPQLRDLVHGLSREDEGDNRDHDREEIERGIEHQPSRHVRPLTGHV